MKTYYQIILALVLVLASAGIVAVYAMSGEGQDASAGAMEGHDHSAMAAADEARPVTLSGDAARRIGVTYAPVTRGSLERNVHTVGFVTVDETRESAVTPKIDGWVEELHVDFTGAPVRAGQPLLEIYSPALVTAQEELILAGKLLAEVEAGGGERPRENARELLQAAHRRLAYWDIPEEEIRAIRERGTVSRTLPLWAPAGGIVVEKNVVQGAHVMPGMNLFRIADLSRVWVEAEVFEKDLSLVRTGQHGTVTFETYPGETFHGRVTYLYPTVSAEARTGKVRLELANPDLKIKPGMYGEVELGVENVEETLLVPRSAVLRTGERSVVFHRMSDGTLHPMEVVTGLSSEGRVQILDGLSEGQTVVSSATFLIDAESNLGAAMAGMAGMDHSGMEMGGEEAGGGEMDHSQHDMSGMVGDTTTRPDTAGSGGHSHGGDGGGDDAVSHDGTAGS